MNMNDENKIIDNNKNKNNRKISIFYVILAVVITFVLCCLVFFGIYQFYLKNLVKTTVEKEVTITDNGISEAVDKVINSVVVVENYRNDKLYATGTGFVYKTDDKYGYILTNEHVISNNSKVSVVFSNNKRVNVNILGSDTYSDIAVLTVDLSNVIDVASMGSTLNTKVGDTVFTVGAPIDATMYSWTVTRGIVSGKDREVEVYDNHSNYVMNVLQTDAAINSGNSGGPLCNSNGEVIGITNMKLASSEVEGMGFAIPIDIALSYAEKFVSGETISRPYLGVSIYSSSITQGSSTSGVYVDTVENGSPAFDAGIKKGDRIIAIDGVNISDSSYFKYELYKHSAGDTITITVVRDGNNQDISVKLSSN